jgi:hypothetical protein
MDERAGIQAAMGRLLDGTPLRSDGKLTIVSPGHRGGRPAARPHPQAHRPERPVLRPGQSPARRPGRRGRSARTTTSCAADLMRCVANATSTSRQPTRSPARSTCSRLTTTSYAARSAAYSSGARPVAWLSLTEHRLDRPIRPPPGCRNPVMNRALSGTQGLGEVENPVLMSSSTRLNLRPRLVGGTIRPANRPRQTGRTSTLLGNPGHIPIEYETINQAAQAA